MADRLRSGLQTRESEFNSHPHLHLEYGVVMLISSAVNVNWRPFVVKSNMLVNSFQHFNLDCIQSEPKIFIAKPVASIWLKHAKEEKYDRIEFTYSEDRDDNPKSGLGWNFSEITWGAFFEDQDIKDRVTPFYSFPYSQLYWMKNPERELIGIRDMRTGKFNIEIGTIDMVTPSKRRAYLKIYGVDYPLRLQKK